MKCEEGHWVQDQELESYLFIANSFIRVSLHVHDNGNELQRLSQLEHRSSLGRESLGDTHGLGNSSPLPLTQEAVMTVKEEGDLNLSKQLFFFHNSRVNGLQLALNELIHAKKECKQIVSVNTV